MGLFGGTARIHEENSLRVAFGDFQISVVYAGKESAVLTLEPAFVGFVRTLLAIPPARPFNTRGYF